MIQDELATALLESTPDGMVVVDSTGIIEVANSAAERIFGFVPGTMAGRPVDDLVPEEQRASHHEHRHAYEHHPATRPMGTGLRLFGQHCDGSLFPVEVSISPVPGDDFRVLAIVRDVTDREDSAARLAMMEDRERIARDLHDMVIQRLFAAGMSLQAVSSDATPMVASRIRDTVDELDEAIRELRAAIFRLGGEVEQRSVSAQLAELVLDRSRPLGFEPEFEIKGDVDTLPDFVVEQLVATVNEGLSNVARHSGATEVTIDVKRSKGRLMLMICDNGAGMADRPKRRGGISNMMWRAAELGGECTLGAGDPRGMVLRWSVPA